MTTPEQQQLNERTCLALGRFVIAFSNVLFALETSTVFLLNANRNLAQAVLADRTARPIAMSFFSLFHARWDNLLTDGDKQIINCLRTELDYLIDTRNRLMHDAWLNSTSGDQELREMVTHRARAHRTGVDYKITKYHPDELEKLAAEARRISGKINGFVFYLRPGQIGPELERRFTITDKKVFRI